MQYDGKRVVSGAYDYLVKVWDPLEGVCLHTLQGHTNRVYSLQVSPTASDRDLVDRIVPACTMVFLCKISMPNTFEQHDFIYMYTVCITCMV